MGKIKEMAIEEQQKQEALKKAMKVVTQAIKEDDGYRMSWQANIAMAFKDEYARDSVLSENERLHIHSMANRAANNFLDVLCVDSEES